MEVLSTPALNTEQSWRLLMSRARVWAAAKKGTEALADCRLALAKINQENAEEVSTYFTFITSVFRTPGDLATALAELERRIPFKSWMLYRATLSRLDVPELEAQAESTLRQMAEAAGNPPPLSAAAWGSIGARAYRKKDFNGALAAFQRGLTFTPEDPELNNNVAYTLGVDLQRPTEALPFAERAARGAASSPMILDTLGAIHLAMGQPANAEPVLVRAVNLASNPGERIPALIHLGTTRFKLGDKAGARQLADQAKRLLDANPRMNDVYDSPLKDLLKTLDGQ
jgi:tetratricopeptide (TPR) repeat protein